MNRGVVVAVDGPSGSGKSSVAKGVAREFGYRYLDTGAMYRAATWWALHQQIDLADGDAVTRAVAAATLVSGTDPDEPTITIGGIDVSGPIRGPEVTEAVSVVSAVPGVRAHMRNLQRTCAADALAAKSGIVVEGRDIGSEVLPDAAVKVYLTADAAVRAARRAAQDADSAHGSDGVAATEAALRRRDDLDRTREHSPLRQHEGATVIDATDLDLTQTIAAVSDLVREAVSP